MDGPGQAREDANRDPSMGSSLGGMKSTSGWHQERPRSTGSDVRWLMVVVVVMVVVGGRREDDRSQCDVIRLTIF